jgi:hypothetical protein
MSISERINPDNLNIHQFQETPEGRPELPFDIEHLTSADRDLLVLEMEEEKSRSDPNLYEYVYYAELINRLWPTEPATLSFTEAEFVEYFNKLNEDSDKSSAISVQGLEFLENIVSFYPNMQSLIDSARIDNLIEMNRQEARDFGRDAHYYHLVKNMATAKSLEPKRVMVLTSEEKSKIYDTLNHYLNGDHPQVFAEMAAKIKIIDPSFNFDITPKSWEIMRERLRSYSGSIAYEMAYDMKILAAYEVNMTSPGVIDIQMYPPDINQSTPSIPEKRKF